MKKITKAALAAALSLGAVTAVGTVPAVAQKAPKPPSIKLSEPVRKMAGELDALIAAGNTAAVDAKLGEMDAAAKTDDDRYYAAIRRLDAAAKRNDLAAVGTAVSALISNPKTPQADLPKYYYFRGLGYSEGKKPAQALADFQKAQELGYQEPSLRLKIVQALIDSGNAQGGVAELRKAIDAERAAGRKPPEDWYKFGIAKLYAANMRTELAEWTKMRLADYPGAQTWRVMLVLYRDGVGQGGTGALTRPQKIDLFRTKGRIRRFDHDLFGIANWAAVMLGQNILPDGYDPLVDATDDDRIIAAMERIASVIFMSK